VHDTVQALQGLVEQVTSVVSDPKLKGGIRGTMSSIEQASANLEQASASFQQASSNVVKITGSVEKLTSDPKLNEDLRATVSGMRATVEQSQILMQRLNQIVGTGHKGGSGVREKIENIREKLRQTEIATDLAMETSPGRPTIDVNAFIPAGSGHFYRLGVNDFTERNKLNLQFGWPFLGNSVRYGWYASKMGLGFDIGPYSHPHLSADLYSIAEPELDVRARAYLLENLDLELGVRSLFHRNTPTVGVTWRR
jgi:hypothetical protein